MKIDDYITHKIQIVSPIIEQKILVESNQEYMGNFIQIANMLNPKFEKNKFNPIQKELMIEVAFSQFEYLNSYLDIQLLNYINTINKNLKLIEEGKDYNGGFYHYTKAIKMNGKVFNRSNKELCTLFLHELNHCFKSVYINGCMIVNTFKATINEFIPNSYKTICLPEEIGAESLMIRILEKNFPSYAKNVNYKREYSDGILSLDVPDDKYIELIPFGLALDRLLQANYSRAYFNSKAYFTNNLKDICDGPTYSNILEICSNYMHYAKKSTRNASLKYFHNMGKTMANIFVHYLTNNKISLEKVHDVIFETPIHETNKADTINLNEKLWEYVKRCIG